MYNKQPIQDKRDLFGVKFLWQGATHLLLWFSVYVHIRVRFKITSVLSGFDLKIPKECLYKYSTCRKIFPIVNH